MQFCRLPIPKQHLTFKINIMNLYTIKFSHTAPKDQEIGLVCLLLANSDEDVYDWIKSEPKINDKGLYNSWSDYEKLKYDEEREVFIDEDGHESDMYFSDSEYNPIDFKTKIISIKGEMNDEDYDLSDAFYGITLYGWELLKENVKTDYSELIELGIVFKC